MTHPLDTITRITPSMSRCSPVRAAGWRHYVAGVEERWPVRIRRRVRLARRAVRCGGGRALVHAVTLPIWVNNGGALDAAPTVV
jgi:hypothetical protein